MMSMRKRGLHVKEILPQHIGANGDDRATTDASFEDRPYLTYGTVDFLYWAVSGGGIKPTSQNHKGLPD
jgi:hypothetical protein